MRGPDLFRGDKLFTRVSLTFVALWIVSWVLAGLVEMEVQGASAVAGAVKRGVALWFWGYVVAYFLHKKFRKTGIGIAIVGSAVLCVDLVALATLYFK